MSETHHLDLLSKNRLETVVQEQKRRQQERQALKRKRHDLLYDDSFSSYAASNHGTTYSRTGAYVSNTNQGTSSVQKEMLTWARSMNHFSFRKAENTTITHTLLTGGVLNIPLSEREMFWQLLKKDFEGGGLITYALSETVATTQDDSPVNLFVEFDPPDGEVWDEDYILDIGRIFSYVLRQHSPIKDEKTGQPQHCVYLSRKISLNDPSLKFSRLHIHTQRKFKQPDGSYVYKGMSIPVYYGKCFYTNLLQALEERKPRPENFPAWDQLLDFGVWADGKANLRLNFAGKAQKCGCQSNLPPPTKKSKNTTPSVCTLVPSCENGYRIIPEIYRIDTVLDEDGQIDDERGAELELDMVEELRATTIQPEPGYIDPFFVLPANSSEPIEIDPKDKNNKNEILPRFGRNKVEQAQCNMWKTATSISRSQTIWHDMLQLVRSLRPEWNSIQIKTLKKVYNEQTCSHQYLVALSGTGSNYCLNRLANPKMNNKCCHSRMNVIGLFIDILGWTQWCLTGTKKEGRLNGIPCNKFRSPKTLFHSQFIPLLFQTSSLMDKSTFSCPTRERQTSSSSTKQIKLDPEAKLEEVLSAKQRFQNKLVCEDLLSSLTLKNQAKRKTQIVIQGETTTGNDIEHNPFPVKQEVNSMIQKGGIYAFSESSICPSNLDSSVTNPINRLQEQKQIARSKMPF